MGWMLLWGLLDGRWLIAVFTEVHCSSTFLRNFYHNDFSMHLWKAGFQQFSVSCNMKCLCNTSKDFKKVNCVLWNMFCVIHYTLIFSEKHKLKGGIFKFSHRHHQMFCGILFWNFYNCAGKMPNYVYSLFVNR